MMLPETSETPVLEKYQIIKQLASGGMAAIYLAEQKNSGELCVVKTLHEHLTKDPVVGNRFLREARVASELVHPNIARLMDAKTENGIFYLAMEFIRGHDLESMMFKLMAQRKMLPPELSVRVTLDVLEALHYAHEYRDADDKHLEIVHRDLSPRNVMITYEGEVKIIDFGLARTNLGEFRTAPGMVLGTLRYMSPEQAVADPVDRRSDIYSWSVVLYEMLSGRPLVVGHTAQEILHAVVANVPPTLSSLKAPVPLAIDEVLSRGMAKDRYERFSTALEMADALRAAAPELALTKPHRIGRFVAAVFPDERMTSLDLAPSADGPAYEPTRAGQADATMVQPTLIFPVSETTPQFYPPTAIFPGHRAMRSHSIPRPRAFRIPTTLIVLVAAVALLVAVALVQMPARTRHTEAPAKVEAPSDTVPSVVAKSSEVPSPPPSTKRSTKRRALKPAMSAEPSAAKKGPATKEPTEGDRIVRELRASLEKALQHSERGETEAAHAQLSMAIARLRSFDRSSADRAKVCMENQASTFYDAKALELCAGIVETALSKTKP